MSTPEPRLRRTFQRRALSLRARMTAAGASYAALFDQAIRLLEPRDNRLVYLGRRAEANVMRVPAGANLVHFVNPSIVEHTRQHKLEVKHVATNDNAPEIRGRA
jgi:hypothetical protein